jgi:hypothetical protein
MLRRGLRSSSQNTKSQSRLRKSPSRCFWHYASYFSPGFSAVRPSEGSRECPLSWDLNVVERVSVADRAAPWVFIFSPGNTEGGCDHADHTERATNGCYAEEGDEAEQG